MAFDPTKPANNSPNSSLEMRNQLNGLKDLIDALGSGKTSFADVNDLISQFSASNVDAVAPLNLTISNPPTQAQVQAVLNALNSLIHALQH